MKVYVDDMLVKLMMENHIQDLKEAFAILKKYHMKLNPVKCAFRVVSRKFHGYMITSHRIKANPNEEAL